MNKAGKSEWVGIRMEPKLRRELEKLAEQEQRSLSGYIRVLILRALGKAA